MRQPRVAEAVEVEAVREEKGGERHVVAAVEVEAVGKAVEAVAGGSSLVWMAVKTSSASASALVRGYSSCGEKFCSAMVRALLRGSVTSRSRYARTSAASSDPSSTDILDGGFFGIRVRRISAIIFTGLRGRELVTSCMA